jgi:hypothetical protein
VDERRNAVVRFGRAPNYKQYMVYGFDLCGTAARLGGLFGGVAMRPTEDGAAPFAFLIYTDGSVVAYSG